MFVVCCGTTYFADGGGPTTPSALHARIGLLEKQTTSLSQNLRTSWQQREEILLKKQELNLTRLKEGLVGEVQKKQELNLTRLKEGLVGEVQGAHKVLAEKIAAALEGQERDLAKVAGRLEQGLGGMEVERSCFVGEQFSGKMQSFTFHDISSYTSSLPRGHSTPRLY